jgi:hypothetical protein
VCYITAVYAAYRRQPPAPGKLLPRAPCKLPIVALCFKGYLSSPTSPTVGDEPDLMPRPRLSPEDRDALLKAVADATAAYDLAVAQEERARHARHEAIFACLRAGITQEEVAVPAGVSRGRISGYAEKLGPEAANSRRRGRPRAAPAEAA